MTDRHIRILRLVAQQRQRELRSHDAVDHDADGASRVHRQHLERAATQTSTRVTDAHSRRRLVNTRLAAATRSP
jgi:hypothetical protein